MVLGSSVAVILIFITFLSVFLIFIERKIHQKRDEDFRYIAESIPQMLWSTDEKGQTKYFNGRWYEYFGISVEDREAMTHWKSYVHPDDLERIIDRWNRALDEKKPYENEYRLKGKDGIYKWFLSRGIPIFNRDGKVLKWIGTATDIHQNKEALRSRDQLLNLLDQEIATRKIQARELQCAIKTRDEFMSMASHELKTPLTSLHLQTQMAKKILEKNGSSAFPPERLQKLIITFDNQVNRLTRLIEDLLDVIKINRGSIPINLQWGNISELVTETVERFNMESPEPMTRNISLDAEKPIHARFDRFRMEQVIYNLLSNAAKHGEGAPIHVEVRAKSSLYEISVSDQGPGIPLEHQKRIFKPFERASSSRQISGLGLGLHIVSKIVEAHGGRVGVKSSPGLGAKFIVEVPSDGPHFKDAVEYQAIGKTIPVEQVSHSL